ncbi:MAG TPA: hypothetical protein VKR31_12375 [Rhizomicrobium sp.]|nr:hypothetical protein [Rhizomicrobium sp.]
MLATRIALIDKTGLNDAAYLSAVAAALSIQASRDLGQFWPVNATVQSFPANQGVPAGFQPIFLVANLSAEEGGVHLNENNQVYANVQMGDGWTIAASHEMCEMLVDPSTNRTQASRAIGVVDGEVVDTEGIFEYLVEVCDPCEGPDRAYSIDGIPVSDFYTNHYFDAVPTSGIRYSFNSKIPAPRKVLKGGYLAWHDPLRNVWQQLDYVNYDPPQIVPVDHVTGARSLREAIDSRLQLSRRISATDREHPLLRNAAAHRRTITDSARARAHLYGMKRD